VPYCGFLTINKERGFTSRDVVNRIDSLLGRTGRVGHAGTLDPMATGVLVVAMGSATRLVSYIHQCSKTYRAAIRLGWVSDTDDTEGDVRRVDVPSVPLQESIGPILDTFQGSTLQVPPSFSALKVKGRRAYDLARKGDPIELAPRFVQINRIEILSYEWPELRVEIECGSGTYIRSIARDVGERLGCGALLDELVRTRIGPFPLDQAFTLGELAATGIARALRPAIEAVLHLPRLRLDPVQVTRIRKGQLIGASSIEAVPDQVVTSPCALVDHQGQLVAIADVIPPAIVKPRLVLPSR
jgi:tRNA pseudouridine55 synthase